MTGKFAVINLGDGTYFRDFDSNGAFRSTSDFTLAFKCFGPSESFTRMDALANSLRGYVQWFNFASINEEGVIKPVVTAMRLESSGVSGALDTLTASTSACVMAHVRDAIVQLKGSRDLSAYSAIQAALGVYLAEILETHNISTINMPLTEMMSRIGGLGLAPEITKTFTWALKEYSGVTVSVGVKLLTKCLYIIVEYSGFSTVGTSEVILELARFVDSSNCDPA